MKVVKRIVVRGALVAAATLLVSCPANSLLSSVQQKVDENKGGGTVATPVILPSTGTYSNDQSVTVTCATPGATIHYTVNGSTPTVSTAVYSGPIAVTGNNTVMNIQAIGTKSGMTDSALAQATITINYTKTSTPNFSPIAGIYTNSQSVTITTSTTGASIRYTTDGTTPTETTGTLYSGPVIVPASQTLKAIAYMSGLSDSTVATADYTVTGTIGVVTISDTSTGPWGAQTISMTAPSTSARGVSTAGAMIAYTTDGTTPSRTNGTQIASGSSVPVNQSAPVKAIAYLPTWQLDSDGTAASLTLAEFDLYLVGRDSLSNQITWANGSTTIISASAWANAIMISGGTIYLGGCSVFSGAIYKIGSGSAINIEAWPASILAMTKDSGGVLYFAGTDVAYKPCYWTMDTDGTIRKFVLNNTAGSGGGPFPMASSISISGTSLYLGGCIWNTGINSNTHLQAARWTTVTGATGGSISQVAIGDAVNHAGMDEDSCVTAIGYDGTHVLSAGYQGTASPQLAAAWQDSGAPTSLSGPGGSNFVVLAGTFTGTTAYLAGYYQGAYQNASYLKITAGSSAPSSIAVDLYSTSSTSKAEAIAVAGSNVYVCGYNDPGGGQTAALWINDASHRYLISGLTDASCIWVTPR